MCGKSLNITVSGGQRREWGLAAPSPSTEDSSRDTEMVLPDSMARAAVGESFVKAVGGMALKHTALTVGAS